MSAKVFTIQALRDEQQFGDAVRRVYGDMSKSETIALPTSLSPTERKLLGNDPVENPDAFPVHPLYCDDQPLSFKPLPINELKRAKAVALAMEEFDKEHSGEFS
jgi:hypothetical protein